MEQTESGNDRGTGFAWAQGLNTGAWGAGENYVSMYLR